jgi:hypothetical protein
LTKIVFGVHPAAQCEARRFAPDSIDGGMSRNRPYIWGEQTRIRKESAIRARFVRARFDFLRPRVTAAPRDSEDGSHGLFFAFENRGLKKCDCFSAVPK